MSILPILFTKPTRVKHKRAVCRDARVWSPKCNDGFASKPGGIMEVAIILCIPSLLGLSCSLGLVSNYDLLVLGNIVFNLNNEAGIPHHM